MNKLNLQNKCAVCIGNCEKIGCLDVFTISRMVIGLINEKKLLKSVQFHFLLT